jgi:hypothetical protein
MSRPGRVGVPIRLSLNSMSYELLHLSLFKKLPKTW